MQLHILVQESLKAQTVCNSGSLSLRSLVIPRPLLRQGRHEYHSQRLPWLYGHIQKIQASKLADHRPYDLKITLDQGTSPTLQSIYSLSQEELAALHKFIDENLATGWSVPSRSPMEHRSSLFGRKMALFTLHWFLRPQPDFQERLIPTSTHFRLTRHTMKGTSLHQDQSLAHIPPCTDFTWRWMEDCIPNLLWFIRVVSNAWRAY